MQVSDLIARLKEFDSDCTVLLFGDDNEFDISEVVRDEEDYGTGEKIVWIKGVG